MKFIVLNCLLLMLMGCQIKTRNSPGQDLQAPKHSANLASDVVTPDRNSSLMPDGVSAEKLLKTQTSWDGRELYYPDGPAEITSAKFQIKENQVTQFHCHSVPTLAYVLKGQVEVETKNGEKMTFNEGESFVEVMNTVHRGRAIEGSVEIIVFYAGSPALPNTTIVENDASGESCSS